MISASPPHGAPPGGASRYVCRLAGVLARAVDVTLIDQPGAPVLRKRVDVRLRECAPDVVHVQHELMLYGGVPSALAFPSWAASLAARYPTVVTVHGVLGPAVIDRDLFEGRMPGFVRAAAPGVLRWIFGRIARLRVVKMTHAERLAERLVLYGARREDVVVAPMLSTLDVVPGSREDARVQLGIPVDAKVVLTWGFLNTYKGFDRVLEGFARFRQVEPRAMLLMNAAPHPRSTDGRAMRAITERARRTPGVRLSGFMPDDEIPRYVAAADVAVFAYSKHVAESGPVTDTAVLGTPVLVSSVFENIPAEISFAPTPAGVCEALQRFFAAPHVAIAAAQKLAAARSDERALDAHLAAYELAAFRLRRS